MPCPALSFAVAFAWDVTYAFLYDRFGGDSLRLPWELARFILFVAPALLGGGVGYLTGQWRGGKSNLVRFAAAAWCVALPAIVIVPFAAFMCVVFHSCFGD